MKTKTKIRLCPECLGKTRVGFDDIEVMYSGQRVESRVHGTWCGRCDWVELSTHEIAPLAELVGFDAADVKQH